MQRESGASRDKADEPVGSRCHGYLNGTLSGRKLPELVQMVKDDRKHGVVSPGVPALLECNCTSIENVTRYSKLKYPSREDASNNVLNLKI